MPAPPLAAAGAAGEDIERQVRETYRQLLELAEAGDEAAETGAIAYTIIYSDSAGKSHFGEESAPFHPLPQTAAGLGSASAAKPFRVDFATLISLPPGMRTDWHPAVQRTLNVIISGELEIEVSDEVRRFGPGSFFIGFDPGTGHISANPGAEPVHMLVAPVAMEPGA